VRTVTTFLASVDCTVWMRVAGVDRALEGVGRRPSMMSEICDVELAATRGAKFLPEAVAGTRSAS
jgi:hypothetical protein